MNSSHGLSVLPRWSGAALSAVMIAHALVLALLMREAPGDSLQAPAVLSVSLLPPEEEALPVSPRPVPPLAPRPASRPLPAPIKTPRPLQPPRLATSVAAPAQEVVAESRVAEVAAPVSPESQAVAPAQATPAVVQTPARFDAAYLDNPRPVYPLMARRLHEEGRVLLRVRVSVNGSAMEVDVHTSSGSSRLDQSALETVRRWKFIPARQGNEAVAAHVLVPIVFSLKD